MFYVYRHIRLDKNIPFYIGIGKMYRYNDYRRAHNKKMRNKIWHSIVKNTPYEVEIIFESEKREIAIEKEKEFIALYGRIDIKTGTLANLTEGGEGAIGMSSEYKEKRSSQMRGNKIMLGRKLSEEHKQNMSRAQKGKKQSPKVIEQLKIRNIGNKYGEKNRGKQHTELVKKHLSKRKYGQPTHQSLAIICVETNEKFVMITECSRKMFDGTEANRMGVKRACDTGKSYGGYHFKYL